MTYPKIELRFHEDEQVYPRRFGDGNCTIVEDVMVYRGKLYEKLEYQFEYDENIAIGCGWCLCPRASCLGYHGGDKERVIILRDRESKSHDIKHVYFNAHSRGQGVWCEWSACEKNCDGDLVVYIARNSHACYPHAGIYVRIFGFANDHCSSRGLRMMSNIEGMHSYDDCVIPTQDSITPCQRFFLPFVYKKLKRK